MVIPLLITDIWWLSLGRLPKVSYVYILVSVLLVEVVPVNWSNLEFILTRSSSMSWTFLSKFVMRPSLSGFIFANSVSKVQSWDCLFGGNFLWNHLLQADHRCNDFFGCIIYIYFHFHRHTIDRTWPQSVSILEKVTIDLSRLFSEIISEDTWNWLEMHVV